MEARKQIAITLEALILLTELNYASFGITNGFYNKESIFTDGFEGDIRYLFQAIGNLGGMANQGRINSSTSVVIICDKIIKHPNSALSISFLNELSDKINQNNSPYKLLKFITESQLYDYLRDKQKFGEDRYNEFRKLINSYKNGIIKDVQLTIF